MKYRPDSPVRRKLSRYICGHWVNTGAIHSLHLASSASLVENTRLFTVTRQVSQEYAALLDFAEQA